ncbi:replicative DNA helicase [Paenibacillus sp. GCM10023248]|uniref:replicative DNA helicase n=1 Tax=unclassified Paenibacillus TaxID=185978 RepID=UPI0023780A69|nr:replicative DNA helicase [Paenibacillus sp. MAHUQ-63]MDD9265996.1 replicative DNA helicase [Paenibacillus sp. MAHUQ-63]
MKNIIDTLGIDMPHDEASENGVIGAILVNPTLFETVSERLKGDEFINPALRTVYKSMGEVVDAKEPLDLITLTSRLQDANKLQTVGGVTFLSNLASGVGKLSNVDHYIRRIKDMYRKRQAIEYAADLLDKSVQDQDVTEFASQAEKYAAKIREQDKPATTFKPIRKVLLNVWDQSEERYKNRHESKGITGIPTGFNDLDKMTKGLQRSDLIILAARPSVGKTAFALNIAQKIGVAADEVVAIFSLEMGAEQLVTRMMSTEGHIDAEKMKTGFFEGDDWEKMSGAMSSLAQAKIFIEDTPTVTVHDIRAKCRDLVKQHGSLGLIVIDYLQLISGHGSKGGGRGNRQEEVSEISRELKQIARDLNVPVIALSQLSRGVEQRQDKRPMMSDLRESGSIEQDADIVAFLYRDDYYDKESTKKNIVEMIIAKHRNGSLGTVELAFLKQYGKFANLDRSHQEKAGDAN